MDILDAVSRQRGTLSLITSPLGGQVMQKLTNAGQNIVSDLSRRYNLSEDAVVHMLVAVNNGGCSMAQFNSPELGGSGQWMRGGMTMVGDMFNGNLKATVDNLCNDLANSLSNTQMFPVVPAGTPGSNQWWPSDLGVPFSSGAQNNSRYAIFQGRLAVENNGNVTVYDTLDHHIGGVSQQQGGDASLMFSSQYGSVSVSALPVISGAARPAPPQTNFVAPEQQAPTPSAKISEPAPETVTEPVAQTGTSEEIINLIGQLAALKSAGVLTDDEFNSKKMELLTRI